MRQRIVSFVAGLVGLALLAWLLWRPDQPPQEAGRSEVRVAAAADLKFALDTVLSSFQRDHPDVRVSVTYGASGTFFAQLSNGAPFDVFFSADVEYPRKLVEQGLADGSSVFLYA